MKKNSWMTIPSWVLVCLGLLMLPPRESLAAEQIYIVKRNDTLYGIARRHSIPMAQLAERNNLSKNGHIYVGQRLILPGKPAPAVAPAPALAAPVRQAIETARVAPGRWKHIVIHHSGVNTGTAAAMDRYHREERHMENGLAYHFVIGNGRGMKDGEIAVGQRWRAQLDGGHLASVAQNKTSLGICLVGNFEKDPPTARQLESLRSLTQSLMTRCKIPATGVKTHREINVVGTQCPGRHFPTKTFLQTLR